MASSTDTFFLTNFLSFFTLPLFDSKGHISMWRKEETTTTTTTATATLIKTKETLKQRKEKRKQLILSLMFRLHCNDCFCFKFYLTVLPSSSTLTIFFLLFKDFLIH
jgi:hypothetical protein